MSSAKAEVGAGTYGIWASRAAKAFLRHAPPWASCELLLVEPFVMGDGSALRTHVQKNFPENRCKFQVSWPHDKLLQHGLRISSGNLSHGAEVETSKLTTAGELKAGWGVNSTTLGEMAWGWLMKLGH